jgi:transmembrane sensor
MSASEERVRDLITQQAADWFVANRAELSQQQRDAFSAWLRASPLHVEEYLGVAVTARDLKEACDLPDNSIDAVVARARADDTSLIRPIWPRVLAPFGELLSFDWQKAAVSVAALGAVGFGFVALWHFGLSRGVSFADQLVTQQFSTLHGELQTIRLTDNSVLHLNTDSAVTVRYSHTERSVTLTAGEADFEVVHEPARPFRVFAGAAEVTDVGTVFDVRLRNDAAVVTVLQGRVAVSNTSPNRSRPSQIVELGAGEQISVADQSLPTAPISVDAERTTAWLHRQIMFEREPLERVATEFNRYSPKPIEIATTALKGLQISGVFATDDTEAFIAFLRSLKGVHVEVTATSIRVSQD